VRKGVAYKYPQLTRCLCLFPNLLLSKMIPIYINSATYFFSILHVTRQSGAKLIYGLLLNSEIYYLSKSLGRNDCAQLDNHALLQPDLLDEICGIISTFETAYEKYPSLEFVNEEIIREVAAIRKLGLENHLLKKQSKPWIVREYLT